jgi:hypothetical protein
MNADERQAIRERLVEHPKMALNHADALRLLDALDEAERRIKALEDDDLDEFIRERAADSSEFALHLLNNDLRARAELAEGRYEEAVELLREVTDELSRWGMGDMHYGQTPQLERVRLPVERARAFLSRLQGEPKR